MKHRWAAAPCCGFTYLGVMFIVSLLSMTAAMASVVWSTVQQRENERELVFAGRQYQAAIERYQQRSKNPARRFPQQLEELLHDSRDLQLHRDLRKLYPDPITGSVHWGLIRLPDGGIAGVHSLSDRQPLQRGLLASGLVFPQATRYRDWRFIAPSGVEALAAVPVAGRPEPGASSSPSASSPDPASLPVAEELDASTLLSAPRPTMRDYRERSPEACSRIVANDERVCQEQSQRFGEEIGRACEESALERSVACALGPDTPLPDLNLRLN